MNKNKFFGLCFFLISQLTLVAQIKKQLELSYSEPAVEFKEALPLGNGRMGAMVYGGILEERLSLNDDTFWSGEPKNWNNPKGKEVVPHMHQALLSGNHQLADNLAKKIQGPYVQSYQPLGDLMLSFEHFGIPKNYKRSLDLNKAIATVKYKVDEVEFKRTYFTSYPDQALVVRLEADKPGKLNFKIKLKGKHQQLTSVVSSNVLVAKGKAPAHVDPSYLKTENPVIYEEGQEGKGMAYSTFVKVINQGGEIIAGKGVMNVRSADYVYLYIATRTSFNGYDKSPSKEGANCEKLALNDLKKLEDKRYDNILGDHVADFQNLFNRVGFSIGQKENKRRGVKEYFKRFKESGDTKLIELAFNMGRYLMISGSRPGTEPLNLQGIWNEYVRPQWSSNYTMNINSQMNYWPCLVANLEECHEPMLSFIEDLAVNGKETALVNYGSDGWVAHHNADIWRQSGPVGDGDGGAVWANFVGGGIWHTMDFWEHYQFTRDRQFLKDKVYPILKGAVEFSLNWLKVNDRGYFVPPYSVSTEAYYITSQGYEGECALNTPQDVALFGELLINFTKTCEILGVDSDLKKQTQLVLNKLEPYRIDNKGKIQEWLEDDFDRPAGANNHHLSHLIGFFPGRHLILQDDNELISAVRRTLEIFGPGGGWNQAWQVNLWARLKDGNQAAKNINWLVGRLHPNLFNPDAGFQIEANMGLVSGICEMLVQSHNEDKNGNPVIELLPALPKGWPSGKINGIRTRGGYKLDIEWEKGKLKKAVIKNVSNRNQLSPKVTISLNKKIIIRQIPINSEVILSESLFLTRVKY